MNGFDEAGFELLKPRSTAAIVGCHLNTLAQWRAKGKGPAFFKIGGRVVYPARALASYLSQCAERGGGSSKPEAG
jgi:hypothetical protein